MYMNEHVDVGANDTLFCEESIGIFVFIVSCA